MKLQFMNGKQESESVARVRVDVVDDELIKLYINDNNVINIWGTYKGNPPKVVIYEQDVLIEGFNLEVV